MSPGLNRKIRYRIVVALGLLLTPVVAFALIASALTADAGPAGWFALVVAPLALLGVGLYAMTGDAPDWLVRPGGRA